MITALAHVPLIVRDYQEALEFYCGKLGFVVVEDTQLKDKRWIRLKTPGGKGSEILLSRAVTEKQRPNIGNQTGGRVLFFLHTDDFDTDYGRLRSLEVEFIEGPREESYGKAAVFKDLYGNRIDLIEPHRAQAQDRVSSAKHIGIVACSAEGAALCFREIARYASQFMGEHRHPQVTLSCIAMSEWMPAFERANYKGVAEFMLREAALVAQAGAEIAICPDNSAHLAFEFVIGRSVIPWLHIANEVGKEAVRNGFKHAALLGTRFTMTGPVYPEAFAKLGLKVTSPPAADQKLVDDIIFHELVKGVFPERSRLLYNSVIERMKQHGCDCVILGCTEIPLLVRTDDCPLPVLDSTRLLAHAAVRYALGK